MDKIPEKLFMSYTYYFTGNYQQCIKECQKYLMDKSVSEAAREFMLRSYVEMGDYNMVICEITDDATSNFLVIKLLAQLRKDSSNFNHVEAKMNELSLVDENLCNDTFVNVASSIYVLLYNPEMALKILHGKNGFESRTVDAMIDLNEDFPLTQLAIAAFDLARNGKYVENARSIYSELSEKYGSSSFLLNSEACCQFAMGNFDECENLLIQSLDKRENTENTLENLIVVSKILKKRKDTIQRYIRQLESINVKNQFLLDLENKKQEFSLMIKM
ncbi:Coatomer subunit epsilon [Intoshia linei]|uniref:Coatomer subunit epsilon n=1 Tax=Intoshia linei TaxID=1819745 RepID=A0A177B4Q1_9BILA|nr:Coatomer subunit epsilon [Intoshia linei]